MNSSPLVGQNPNPKGKREARYYFHCKKRRRNGRKPRHRGYVTRCSCVTLGTLLSLSVPSSSNL